MNHLFHPLVWQWFAERFGKATAAQEAGLESIAQGNDTLIAAPTGSGKTLAAFFWSIDRLIRRAVEGRLEDKTSVVYVSPLKALENDIQKNLQEPLSGILSLMGHQGELHPDIRVAVRSGDTPNRKRQLMLRPPPTSSLRHPNPCISSSPPTTAVRSSRLPRRLSSMRFMRSPVTSAGPISAFPWSDSTPSRAVACSVLV